MDDAGQRPGNPFAAGASACALAVTRIALTNFRSYGARNSPSTRVPVVLAGANGTGKTNLLEAILAALAGTRFARRQTQHHPAQKSHRGRTVTAFSSCGPFPLP
jgi:recombinational DNA repair ATPase RecF